MTCEPTSALHDRRSLFDVRRVSDPPRLALGELIGSLSFALDMTEGQPPGHSVRCCWIGTRIGRALGMSSQAYDDLYYALLLKDLGCSSNAARICALYLTDDLRFKHDFKVLDDSLMSVLRFVITRTGAGAGLSERLRATVNALRQGSKISRELFETRCHRGADIAARMRFPAGVQDAIRNLDEHWNGRGQPCRISGNEIPRIANIALLAQVVDVFHTEGGPDAAMAEATRRAGSWFDPQLVATLWKVSRNPGFWQALRDPELETRVFALDPRRDGTPVDEDYLDDIAEAFADVVDAKSPFTADHSKRVMFYADMIAEELGLESDHRRWLRRAALLHDVGKLAVSNQILDKSDKPDAEEWQVIRSHPTHSRAILERIAAFRDIAPVAGAHHERLDGAGYPLGLDAASLCLEVRILTVADVFDALSAARPYRAALPLDTVHEIMGRNARSAFDPLCLEALKTGLSRLGTAVAQSAA
ncbi:HD-GYP domain-containing protein [Roseisalinus antarcticus]|uniref:Cyclic di-GMP phosphodiesterase response regulator RpfG n=1 Tax=Roseisalinus antarcticus TaxID=254357 RepID=A0A1Y5RJT5_9RHOB|nr:HD domain-containing phosphohydrolase [Roseisalinus antarcticus]SLN19186.1 Cyclic di-GMP phosphodiesterase response regulator RpfG [Roseisalinus antarcticus]